MTADSVVQTRSVAASETDLLGRVTRVLSLLADLSRADALLMAPEPGSMRVLTHARPHSIAPVHRQMSSGEHLSRSSNPVLFQAFEQNRYMRRLRSNPDAEGAPVLREIFPVRDESH